MKKGDLLWGLGILAFVAFVVFPSTQAIFNTATATHPYMMDFKVSILATMGELLARRIVVGDWEKAIGTNLSCVGMGFPWYGYCSRIWNLLNWSYWPC